MNDCQHRISSSFTEKISNGRTSIFHIILSKINDTYIKSITDTNMWLKQKSLVTFSLPLFILISHVKSYNKYVSRNVNISSTMGTDHQKTFKIKHCLCRSVLLHIFTNITLKEWIFD